MDKGPDLSSPFLGNLSATKAPKFDILTDQTLNQIRTYSAHFNFSVVFISLTASFNWVYLP